MANPPSSELGRLAQRAGESKPCPARRRNGGQRNGRALLARFFSLRRASSAESEIHPIGHRDRGSHLGSACPLGRVRASHGASAVGLRQPSYGAAGSGSPPWTGQNFGVAASGSEWTNGNTNCHAPASAGKAEEATMARGTMKVVNPYTSEMVCIVCGDGHYASIKPGSGGLFRRGAWTCRHGCKRPVRPESNATTAMPLATTTVEEGSCH